MKDRITSPSMDAKQWAQQHAGSTHSQCGEDGLLKATFDALGTDGGYVSSSVPGMA